MQARPVVFSFRMSINLEYFCVSGIWWKKLIRSIFPQNDSILSQNHHFFTDLKGQLYYTKFPKRDWLYIFGLCYTILSQVLLWLLLLPELLVNGYWISLVLLILYFGSILHLVFQSTFIHLFLKILLTVSHVSATILSSKDTSVNKWERARNF